MKLWLLRPVKNRMQFNGKDPWSPWYDKAFGFIIAAPDEETARKLANDNGGDETGKISRAIYRTGGDAWLDGNLSVCRELVAEGDEAYVIMQDFAAA